MHESGLVAEFLHSEWRADAVEVTSSAFLGLTTGCARCHDHKFDPILQRDFYGMAAVFAGSEEREIPTVHVMSVFDYRQFYPKLIATEQLKSAHDRIMAGAKERILTRKKAQFPREAVIDHRRLTYFFQGRNFRLSDVGGDAEVSKRLLEG